MGKEAAIIAISVSDTPQQIEKFNAVGGGLPYGEDSLSVVGMNRANPSISANIFRWAAEITHKAIAYKFDTLPSLD
jgi:hypothetical protein